MTGCICGASVDGKWADVHDAGCPAIAYIKTEQQLIDAAWETHKAAAPVACALCRGAGHVTYRDGIPQETFDVEKEEHMIESCPLCSPTPPAA